MADAPSASVEPSTGGSPEGTSGSGRVVILLPVEPLDSSSASRRRLTVVDDVPVVGLDDAGFVILSARPGTVEAERRREPSDGGTGLRRAGTTVAEDVADRPLDVERAPLPVEPDESGPSATLASGSAVRPARSLGLMMSKCRQRASNRNGQPPVAAAVADASPTRTVTMTVVPAGVDRDDHDTTTPPLTAAILAAAPCPPVTPARAAPSAAVRARAASTASLARPASAIADAAPSPNTIAPNGTI